MQIFSHLDVLSLGRAAQVCHQWNNLTKDEILWESKLKMDVEKWQVIDHLSHPGLYRETATDLTAKEMYVYTVYFYIPFYLRVLKNNPSKLTNISWVHNPCCSIQDTNYHGSITSLSTNS